MSFLQRVQAKSAALPAEIEGIPIHELPVTMYGKDHSKKGIHVMEPTEQELADAVDTALRDNYPAIYVYNQKPKAHLYIVKADTEVPWATRKKEATELLDWLKSEITSEEGVDNQEISKALEKLDGLLVRRVSVG